ncbi:MAG: transglycosylase SLT domain-containing protein [Bdellovibrionaceae bacterium]|nr:transglycosylase SLT domain-containing protein [Pseudobdellovibrionaceae bacterium]
MTFAIVAGLLYLISKDGAAVKATGSNIFTAFDALFQKYAKQNGLDWKMLKAIAMNESGLGVAANGLEASVARGLANPNDVEGSKSSDGKSWGLMQVTVTTAKDFDSSATPQKLNDPEYSIRIAAEFIAWLTKQFPTSEPRYTEWVVKSYNQGRGNSAKERRGEIAGYAGVYWDRYLRNYAKI